MTISALASEADLKSLWDPPEIDSAACRADKQALSAKAREIARGRDALFHGTRYGELILASGFLKAAQVGDNCVSFSRSPEVAAFSAALPRYDDEGSGAILILDRASLRTQYKLECHADDWERNGQIVDEFEERVYFRDVEIGSHLIGLVTVPKAILTSKARALRRAAALRFALGAADCGCGMRWKTCAKCKKKQFEKAAEQLERTHPGISEWCGLAGLSTLKTPGSDREMVEILALVLQHDEQALLAAVELALEAGAPTKTHILNLLRRLVDGKPTDTPTIKVPQPLTLTTESRADVEQHDALCKVREARHAS
jgi:hypothetical protein